MPRPITDPNEAHSYADWQRLGYQVQRGEHPAFRSPEGIPQFRASQVRPRNTAPENPNAYQNRANSRQRRRERRAQRPPPPELHISFDEAAQPRRWNELHFTEERVRDYQQPHAAWQSPGGTYYYSSPLTGMNYRTYGDLVNNVPVMPSPWWDEGVSKQTLEELQAQEAYNAALMNLKALEQKHARKYVPEDDESASGFKQLCAVERQIKEK